MASNAPQLTVWQWNCRSFNGKKAAIQQHIKYAKNAPDVILLQETLEDAPTLPGYRAHSSPTEGRGVCTFVKKGLPFIEHDYKNTKIEHTFIELIPTRKRKCSIFILNIYSSPTQRLQRFRSLLHRACKTADRHRLLIGGDFNAADPAWGYSYSLAKGRNLSQDAHELDLVLITEPAHPTRIGNSVSRDTTPDLTFIKNFGSQPATWHNTSTDLGSDHLIIEIKIPLPGAHHAGTRKFKWIDWNDFRKLRESQHDENSSQITDIDAWCRDLTGSVEAATKEIETELEVDKMDSRLAHMIEAKNSILARWKKQRLNRKLRKKIAELNRNMEEHCRELCKQQWHELCNAINGQMHNGKAWNILRQLLGETKTKSHSVTDWLN